MGPGRAFRPLVGGDRLEHQIEYVDARTARAKMANGVLRIRMPRHWPADYRDQTVAKFLRWAAKHHAASEDLPPLSDWDGRRWGEAELGAYVRRLNDETLRAPLRGVRIGNARRSRLAQCNTATGVLTFSRYAIDGMPARALRYLVLHELAHLFEANHSARFWAHVARHEPDYKAQRLIAQAHHARMTELAEAGIDARAAALDGAAARASAATVAAEEVAEVVSPAPVDAADGHPFGPLFAFVPGR